MDFVCEKCGLCCKNIGNIEQLKDYDNGKGMCIYLTDENICAIYENRPIWCNVKELYQYLCLDISWEKWLELNYYACSVLQSKS